MTVILAHSPVSLSVAVCKDFVSLDYNLHVSFHEIPMKFINETAAKICMALNKRFSTGFCIPRNRTLDKVLISEGHDAPKMNETNLEN